MIIGKIAKAQGIKGEIKLNLNNENIDLTNVKTFVIENESYKVENIFKRPNGIFAKLEKVDDRTSAESLQGKFIDVLKEELETLNANEFYFDDLIGAKIVDQNGQRLAEIVDIEQYGAADVIVINENGKFFNLPFLNDIFLKFDKNKKEFVVDKERYEDMKVF